MNQSEILKAIGIDDIPAVKSVEMLSMRQTDALVLKCDHVLSIDTVERIRDLFEKRLPGVIVIVLDGGMDISILRKEA